MKARKGTQKEEGWEGKGDKKRKRSSKGKGKERESEQEEEQDEKRAKKASLKEDENATGPSIRILPDIVATTTTTQDPISNGSPADDGESAHVASDTASLSTPDQPPLGPAGSATLPAQPENETHDQDYTEESSLNTQPDVPRTDASVHEEQDESVAPPRDTHPPAKVKKVILRVREPEPELEIQGATRSRMSRVARSHQQPYQVARQKRAEGEKALADVRTRGENVTGTENMAPEGGSSSSTGTQCAPVAAQDPTQWLGDFWVELEGMLAATPSEDKNDVAGLSTRAGIEDVPRTEQAIRSEDPCGTEAAAEDTVDVGTPSVQPSSSKTRHVVVHDALKDLKSMLDGFKQSLAAAESSAQPDVSVLANSSGETGSSELSQIFTTTDLSVDTQESELQDYEDVMAERTDAGPSQPNVQVKQEEEEYVFPPWDREAASGSHLNEDIGEEDPRTGSGEQTSVDEVPRTIPQTSDAAQTNRAKRQREDDEDDDEFLPLKKMRALVLTSSEE
ncbi:hypothetical protein BDV93DRAFT_555399 [Ceratobasidium sp. AG-I]|nr:hypothetical protein BDV93DRAFT_555399 [Ceratobasidium sp. AG-I]